MENFINKRCRYEGIPLEAFYFDSMIQKSMNDIHKYSCLPDFEIRLKRTRYFARLLRHSNFCAQQDLLVPYGISNNNYAALTYFMGCKNSEYNIESIVFDAKQAWLYYFNMALNLENGSSIYEVTKYFSDDTGDAKYFYHPWLLSPTKQLEIPDLLLLKIHTILTNGGFEFEKSFNEAEKLILKLQSL